MLAGSSFVLKLGRTPYKRKSRSKPSSHFLVIPVANLFLLFTLAVT